MTYWILKDNGMVIPRSTVRPITNDEKIDATEVKQRANFDEMVKKKFGSYDPEELELFDNDQMEQPMFSDDESITDENKPVRETDSTDFKSVASEDEDTVIETDKPDRESAKYDETNTVSCTVFAPSILSDSRSDLLSIVISVSRTTFASSLATDSRSVLSVPRTGVRTLSVFDSSAENIGCFI